MKREHLSLLDRQDLYRMKQRGYSIRRIAKELKFAASTISRELKRNGARNRQERRQPSWSQAQLAHQRMFRRRRAERPRMRLKNMRIRCYVEDKIKGYTVNGRYYPGWSPEQIANRLPFDLPGESISHEAIYQWIFAEATHLITHLERLGKYKRRRKRTENLGRKQRFKENTRHISQRPEGANNRSELGHIERDTIVSVRGGKAALLNTVDRKSRLMRAKRIPDLTANSGCEGTITLLRNEPKQARKTMTSDLGSENGKVLSLEKVLEIDAFSCSPHAAWERGSVERANKTLRRIFPKGTNFDLVSDEDVRHAVSWYNSRPMKVLGFLTPREVHEQELAKYLQAA